MHLFEMTSMSEDNRGLLEGNAKASKLLNDEYKQVKEFDQEEGWEEVRIRK